MLKKMIPIICFFSLITIKSNTGFFPPKLNEGFYTKKNFLKSAAGLLGLYLAVNGAYKYINKKPFVSATGESNSPAERLECLTSEAAKNLRACYFEGYAFPLWAIDFVKNSCFDECAKTATVYYNESATLKDVKQMVLQREPVNISMKRKYKQLEFQENFGWRTGYYGDHFTSHNNSLAPNIAIYCKTPYQVNGGIFDAASPKFIHVINSVGFAFDNFSQPDYQYFFGTSQIISEDKKLELIQNMVAVFAKIFQCAIDKSMQTIVLSGVGCTSFAELYPGRTPSFIKEIYLPSLKLALESFADSLTKANIKNVHLMGGGNINEILKQDNFIKTLGFDYKSVGFIPEIFESVYQDSLDKTLFVNAWDPWSIVGNGNAQDPSLDGCFGRLTAMAVLCWPKTNPYLESQDVFRQIP